MADEKAAGNSPANSGGGNTNKGSGKSNNRRRSMRSKRRGGRKPEENSEQRGTSRTDSRTETRTETRNETRSEPRSESRAARGQQNTSKAVDKTTRDNRERRRRRRARTKQRGQNETPSAVVEDVLKDLPPLVPAFVYTHVLRPAMRDGFEFRTEHFSKVTRKLDDFHIDLSALYPNGGDEIKGVADMLPASDRPLTDDREFDDGGYDDEDDAEYENHANRARFDSVEESNAADVIADIRGKMARSTEAESIQAEIIDDPDWDAEESDDAARLDGATMIDGGIADDFYGDLDDSVVDEYPDEDLDD